MAYDYDVSQSNIVSIAVQAQKVLPRLGLRICEKAPKTRRSREKAFDPPDPVTLLGLDVVQRPTKGSVLLVQPLP